MRRVPLLLLSLAGTLALLVLAVVPAVYFGLNTPAGRSFAVAQINRFAGPQVQISGLGGRFPGDITLAAVTLSDAKGVWLTGQTLELRWHPAALWRRDVDVIALTAGALDVERAPVAGPSHGGGSGFSLPNFKLQAAKIAIGALTLGPALAGQRTTLALAGEARLTDPQDGSADVQALTADGQAHYDVAAAIGRKTVDLHVAAAEPPVGLLGHFAGPQVHDPLNLAIDLAGPRDDAALGFTLGLGAAQLHGQGHLGLAPENRFADVVLSIPALAPFAAIAKTDIAGATKLHLKIVTDAAAGVKLSLDGEVALTAAPDHIASLVGTEGKLSLQADLQNNTVNIAQLDVTGAGFHVAAAGSVARSGVDLNTQIALNDVADLSPGLSGNVAETGTIIGTAQDFGVNTLITGDIEADHIPSGPFSIAINAQHLPDRPAGTLTGSGALENAPLLLDAQFARNADGSASVTINNAIWRSLNAQGDLALAPGSMLPTGNATFAIGNLGDFRAFSPIPLSGSVTGDFAHEPGAVFKLDLTARRLVALPALGPVDANIHALGPTAALAVHGQADVASLFGSAARLALAGVLDLDARSASLASLTAGWHGLSAVLQGPAGIETRPGITVHHLALGLNGGRITLDGALTPVLHATMSVQKLPANLAKLFVPSIDASGSIGATATLTGRRSAPNGRITLSAQDIRLHSGPAASLPPADLTASADLAGPTATIAARLAAGPDLALNAAGDVPARGQGALNLHVTGRTDLRLLDPILAAAGSIVRGVVNADVTISGTTAAPRADGDLTLASGSVENIASGLNLTHIAAALSGAGRTIALDHFSADAGPGTISGHGTADLGTPGIPFDLTLNAEHATPISSDIVTETVDAGLTLQGGLRTRLALAGTIKIDDANINIPKSLPPSVANLPIVYANAPPAPPPPPALPIGLNLTLSAGNRIFIRGDGLFAELGGRVHITGTAADPDPQGGFDLIRGNLSLIGTTLEFTSGNISFTGDGFMPTLDLEASTFTTDNNSTASLIVGGTAAKPTITLTSTPPLPPDEILAQLLFGQSASSLSPFQAASLAAALAQLSGVGGGANPLDSVRNALGLDELSLAGSGSGPPSLQAGRYVAPGVYVGATQATNGQGTQANVQINLYKGLKLETGTGTSSSGSGNASSVGLTYQFNY